MMRRKNNKQTQKLKVALLIGRNGTCIWEKGEKENKGRKIMRDKSMHDENFLSVK